MANEVGRIRIHPIFKRGEQGFHHPKGSLLFQRGEKGRDGGFSLLRLGRHWLSWIPLSAWALPCSWALTPVDPVASCQPHRQGSGGYRGELSDGVTQHGGKSFAKVVGATGTMVEHNPLTTEEKERGSPSRPMDKDGSSAAATLR